MAFATMPIHFNEVHGAAQATRQLGDIDVETEFTVLQLEKLVSIIAVKEIEARASRATGRQELQPDGAVGEVNPPNSLVSSQVQTLQGTPLGACLCVWTLLPVPPQTVQAWPVASLLVSCKGVQPAPLCVHGDRCLLRNTSLGRAAVRHWHRWARLLPKVPCLLRNCGHGPLTTEKACQQQARSKTERCHRRAWPRPSSAASRRRHRPFLRTTTGEVHACMHANACSRAHKCRAARLEPWTQWCRT
mmetsp:Transcript_124940/g.314438  ORF Transcript_124940/g.314438 Transcript_124940/m.314438 type:complete len:246 (+) Transcript_124940:1686-2423(+)